MYRLKIAYIRVNKNKTIIVTLQKMIYFDKNRQKETQHG